MSTDVREIIFVALEDALKEIGDNDDYLVQVRTVSRNDMNIVDLDRGKFPIAAIVDTGPEIILEKDRFGTRYLTTFHLVGFIQSAADNKIQEELNELLGTLRRFINSSPSLGSACLGVWDTELVDRTHETHTNRGGFSLGCQLVWYQDHQVASSTPSGDDAYGPNWIELGHTKIEGLLASLATELASGYAYNFAAANIFRRHNRADLPLNAITVECIDSDTTPEEGGIGADAGSLTLFHEMTFTVRVHTAFEGGRFDSYEAACIANSIAVKLLENYDLGDDYDLVNVPTLVNAQPFDGGTLGSELTAIVRVPAIYIQATP